MLTISVLYHSCIWIIAAHSSVITCISAVGAVLVPIGCLFVSWIFRLHHPCLSCQGGLLVQWLYHRQFELATFSQFKAHSTQSQRVLVGLLCHSAMRWSARFMVDIALSFLFKISWHFWHLIFSLYQEMMPVLLYKLSYSLFSKRFSSSDLPQWRRCRCSR